MFSAPLGIVGQRSNHHAYNLDGESPAICGSKMALAAQACSRRAAIAAIATCRQRIYDVNILLRVGGGIEFDWDAENTRHLRRHGITPEELYRETHE